MNHHSDENSECTRCNTNIEYNYTNGKKIGCSLCPKVYHELPCSNLRGCYRDKKYFCFDCFAYNNLTRQQKDEEEKRFFNREYLSMEK